MQIKRNQTNREKLGKEVARVINDVFQQGTETSVHWELQNAQTEHTGLCVSSFVRTASVTRGERRALREQGLNLVDPDIDETVEEVPVEELEDATETETELVLELEEEFVNRAV